MKIIEFGEPDTNYFTYQWTIFGYFDKVSHTSMTLVACHEVIFTSIKKERESCCGLCLWIRSGWKGTGSLQEAKSTRSCTCSYLQIILKQHLFFVNHRRMFLGVKLSMFTLDWLWFPWLNYALNDCKKNVEVFPTSPSHWAFKSVDNYIQHFSQRKFVKSQKFPLAAYAVLQIYNMYRRTNFAQAGIGHGSVRQ